MNIVLGITGSIGAYKAVELLRTFMKKGHQVSVVMTKAAQHFAAPLSMETFIPYKVYTDQFAPHQDPLLHINLGKDNDLLLVAPASANIIGKMAHGIADDLLSTSYLAFYKTVVIAPAMNSNMWEHPAVQANLELLKKRGVKVIEPEEGMLACNVEGKGKFPEPETIYQFCMNLGLPAPDQDPENK